MPVALVGAVLPGDFKIKKSKLRGVVSCGMCCSKRELGLGQDHSGIWVLPDDAPVGRPMADFMGAGDTVLDLEITPNRPDCLSMVGMAARWGPCTSSPVAWPLSGDVEKLAAVTAGEDVAAAVTVEVPDAARCPRYTARGHRQREGGAFPRMACRARDCCREPFHQQCRGRDELHPVPVRPAAARLRFRESGQRDGCAHIVVRAAADGERLTTLDGEDRELTSDMTVIATPERAVALAGVMGGENSEVTEETTCVLLESAAFERGRTSRTSRNLGLISEASMRYERGVDDHLCEVVSQAAAALLAEVSGGTVRPGVVDVYELPTARPELIFRIPRFVAMMGADIPADFIEDILVRLGCAVEATDDASVLSVLPPTFRPDLEREIDLYEEVLRLWGMDRIPPTLPGGRERVGARTPEQETVRVINDTLRASGMNETMTYSFAEPG